jgi:hypothetical protein
MVTIIPSQTVLTPAGAANDLQNEGLDALGLTVPNISPVWSSNAPGTYDGQNLTLSLTNPRAPFRGIRTFDANPTFWSDVSGTAIAGPVAVFRLHPETARRLETLISNRYGAPFIRSTPIAMVVRGVTLPAILPVPEWFFAGDVLDTNGANLSISFHDHRGLPICPIAVAAMFSDFLGWLPALQFTNGVVGAVTDASGVTTLANSQNGTVVHVIDPHGWGFTPRRDAARLRVLDNANAEVSTIASGAAISTIAANQTLGRSNADNTADGANLPLRWGWAQTGTLARANLTPPALPAGVNRQFFRVMAVDLDWHLRGNRSNLNIGGIPGDDGTTPAFLLPQVRDPVPNFAYLHDGNEVLGAASQMTAGFTVANSWAIAVSPQLIENLPAPAATGPNGHWPAFPAPNTGAVITAATNPITGATAVWRAISDGPNADWDVIVTLPADSVPDGAHVRVFPRQFIEIDAIEKDQPSFVRGDGGAAIATAGTATKVLLVNPFALIPAMSKPADPFASVDIVVTDRQGTRRLFSEARIKINGAPAVWTDNLLSFGGAPVINVPAIQTVLNGFHTRSVASSPLFGIPQSVVPTPGAPTGILDLVRKFASESQPRQGPRLPTQMRFETMLITANAAAADTPQNWRALLTGARWTYEARASRPDLGNPGNPAGLDVHATGIRADGWLAYDLALHAVKRAQPMLPTGPDALGWLVETGGNNWNAPPADTTGTVAAIALETVAAICDTPELSIDAVPEPTQGDSLQNLVNNIASALGITAPTITFGNEASIRPRLQREIITAKHGQRDTLWSLRRALGEARELIYIEGPAFAKTARSNTGKAYEIDLVDVIRQQMNANKRLKVIICVPRLGDFEPVTHAPWLRTALKHRMEAIQHLTNFDRNRVAAFHPIGFPGRPAAIRSTTVIVDDVWCLSGTSHFRRRGMTFDGSMDVASIDRAITNNYSSSIAAYRRQLMADRLGVNVPGGVLAATPLWIRLSHPESTFDAMSDLLQQGGLGRCSPVWAGPNFTPPEGQSDDVTDPDGANGANFMALLASLLSD